ncbi:glycerol-3-phosphate dehydrogenase [Chromobacterium sphagni]|uniref:Glycerol-3-phosphate dehydrogenase n=1 Tax=Chromobacterium sphagni TaxID=1903179 RepID=A0A1S1WYJ9_9NEIS|nr:glycerol-3-phosphate dehydrogenase [Chromobacterium sphagni]OHX12219.1 glycerol-3-phosphate dehydrogenase [Chromobacterium sphagni]OHX21696.1 glycerol-3-phosphate dehydrogenase [Chromobacterium sphagni]
MDVYDLMVIGGGINGAGIARDAAGRGLSVALCEKDDLASHTSSASTKLIHGGLRYLEYYEFGLVRKALQEREVLLKAAPHIIWPLRFVMPHARDQRPEWMIRAGLFLYDHLAKREVLPGSETVSFARHPSGAPLKDAFKRGFVYSDGWVQDARLVVLNAMDAAEHGAKIHTRTACVAARRDDGHWLCTLEREDGSRFEVRARALVNAAGPWVQSLIEDKLAMPASKSIRLVKGSHIVVKKLFDHPFAYIFQNPDQRIIFAIPYEKDFTLIGTTDVEYHGDPAQVAIDAQEIAYLCEMSNRYFHSQIGPQDVLSTYSGVRPLLDDAADNAASVTRDYALETDLAGAPLLSVFGGKITTFRKLAEEAVDKLAPLLGNRKASWTADAPLPGGDMPGADFGRFLQGLRQRHPWLPAPLAERWARAYGTRVGKLIAKASCLAELGAEILPGLYEAELEYLAEHEWATRSDDILWRRSKLRLHLPADAAEVVDQWLARRLAARQEVLSA